MNGEVVQELTFQGSGCAISKASALLLTKNADTGSLSGLARPVPSGSSFRQNVC